MQFPTPREAVVIDQVGCRYTPHVAGVMTGQTLTFRNSDGLLHNINATPQINRPFNFSQPVNMDTNRTFSLAEVAVPVRCDVHGWMRAYVGVTAHPYNAVTNSAGTFSLQDLPPGEYVIEAWHSQLGVQEQTVTVATGETAQVSFNFTADMLADAVVPMGEPIDPHDHNPLVERLLGANGHSHHGHAPAAGTR
jgi:plastocyanin